MKSKILAGTLMLVLAASLQSCKKHEKEEGKIFYHTIEITLDENKSYQYNFGIEKNELSITEQSKAYLVSEIDQTNEVSYFNYLPKINFVGTDEVKITMRAEQDEKDHYNGGGQGGSGNCQNHRDEDDDDDKTIYTFKFTVKKVAINTKSEFNPIQK